MRVHVGDAVADRFVIERHAAGGGMGEVYQALDRHTDRRRSHDSSHVYT